MFDFIRTWILSIVAMSLITAIVVNIVPKGRSRTMTGFVCSLVTIILLVSPIMRIDTTALAQNTRLFDLDVTLPTAELEARQDQLLQSIIQEQTAAYIWDKAQAIGEENLVFTVETVPLEDGTPVPHGVRIDGTVSGNGQRELSRYITDTLGIPADRQHWSIPNEE